MARPNHNGVNSATETPSDANTSRPSHANHVYAEAWRYIAPLIRFAQETYGTTHGIGDRFIQEVSAATQRRAQLVLSRDEERGTSRFSSESLVLPVQHAGISYGSLVITRAEEDEHEFGLPLEICAQLARIYAWLLHVLNEGAMLQFQYQRLEIPGTDGEELSRRQRDVLARMVYGQDRESISSDLNITVATVDSHRQAIYERLGARSSTEAVLIAHRTGRVRCVALGGTARLPGHASRASDVESRPSRQESRGVKLPGEHQDNCKKGR